MVKLKKQNRKSILPDGSKACNIHNKTEKKKRWNKNMLNDIFRLRKIKNIDIGKLVKFLNEFPIAKTST